MSPTRTLPLVDVLARELAQQAAASSSLIEAMTATNLATDLALRALQGQGNLTTAAGRFNQAKIAEQTAQATFVARGQQLIDALLDAADSQDVLGLNCRIIEWQPGSKVLVREGVVFDRTLRWVDAPVEQRRQWAIRGAEDDDWLILLSRLPELLMMSED